MIYKKICRLRKRYLEIADDATRRGRFPKEKLLSEGFEVNTGKNVWTTPIALLGPVALTVSSSEVIGYLLPFPMFNVYFGQERMPQQGYSELCMKG